MDPTVLRFYASTDGFLVLPLVGTRRRRRGRRGRRCRGGRGRRPFTGGMSPGHRSGPSAPTPRQEPAMSSGNDSSERTRTATPPYPHSLVLTGNGPSPAAERLPTPTPPEEPPRRPLAFRLRRPGCTDEGVGIITDLNPSSPAAAAAGIAGFGPQAGPSNAGGRHTVTTFTGATTDVHPSFIFEIRAARRGAPPHPNPGGSSTAAASAASAAPPAPTLARIFGRVAVTDRRPAIRRGTCSPAALGLSSDH
ncbi:hypothetical protein C2845_PM01G10860 [Panicum miliaceum]|uniref:Uncharacterized protein n=1 Tax=Panicum miliaceum TaxID=4540 RepID=A0A3L6TGV4_PANMI|nr:hypothetical protein C2845_PM01G10860 [Panicum miliaceum]